MTVACYLDVERRKADGWIKAFASGCGGRLVYDGEHDAEASEHVVMGNWPTATALIPGFKRDGAPFWYLDSAYLQGASERHLRVEPGRFWPELSIGDHGSKRFEAMNVAVQPWQRDGRHVLICLHGFKFGRPWSIDIAKWHAAIVNRIRKATDRPVVVRPKLMNNPVPLAAQLKGAWCVVTHSSTAAVEAVLAGIPAFCEPTCAAAPVGCTDFSRIDTPVYPDREPWLAELAWRQWTRSEMASGKAWACLRGEA